MAVSKALTDGTKGDYPYSPDSNVDEWKTEGTSHGAHTTCYGRKSHSTKSLAETKPTDHSTKMAPSNRGIAGQSHMTS